LQKNQHSPVNNNQHIATADRGALHSKNPVHFVKKSGKNPNKSGKSNRFSLQKSGGNPLKNPRIFKNPKIPYASSKNPEKIRTNPENPHKSGKSNRFSLQKSAKKSGKIR
jgi:hypothetical protein